MSTESANTPMQQYRRFRAPKQDGSALVDPAGADLLELVRANRSSRPQDQIEFFGRTVGELAQLARKSLVLAATEFTATFCDTLPTGRTSEATPLILSGHQPELFHPGVWFKNFMLDALAKQIGGVGVHLLIDSDLCRDTSVRVPTGSVSSPRVETVAYDERLHDLPYEERKLENPELLSSFGNRVAEAMGPLINWSGDAPPLAVSMTSDLASCARATENLGEALSQARRLVEQRWGSQTLELPLSHVCDGEVFQWFALWLLTRAPNVRAAYNGALNEYRTAHGLRNNAQPLPDLAEMDGSVESPLWVWTKKDPIRRPLFVKQQEDNLLLSNGAGGNWSVSLPGEYNEDSIPRLWAELTDTGLKIRSRALVTTLFARMFLCDLFLHGIGGSKYDEVTDQIAVRLWGIKPPAYATLTATLHLPIEHDAATPNQMTEIEQTLRKLRYHPETFIENISANDAAQTAMATKQKAITITKTKQNAAERHRLIESANTQLQAFVADKRQAVLEEQRSLKERLRATAILDSREYSFSLFPEAYLRTRIERLVDRQR